MTALLAIALVVGGFAFGTLVGFIVCAMLTASGKDAPSPPKRARL